MAKLTRRGFIVTSAGAAAGVAAAGALTAGPRLAKLLDTQPAAAIPTTRAAGAASDPIVAYVRDATKGEVGLLVGTREVTVNDPVLVAHIFDAAAR